MPQALLRVSPAGSGREFDARGFLERLRQRLLRVTAGMRPGAQRLDLAVETFWYAALDAARERPIPWTAISGEGHPLRVLLGPVRLMLRSELIHAGTHLPDALIDDVLQHVLAVAESESQQQGRDEALREDFTTWLRRRMRGVERVTTAAWGLPSTMAVAATAANSQGALAPRPLPRPGCDATLAGSCLLRSLPDESLPDPGRRPLP